MGEGEKEGVSVLLYRGGVASEDFLVNSTFYCILRVLEKEKND